MSTTLNSTVAEAWDTLDTVARLADAITWDDGSDSLSAMQCAQSCTAARDLLPLPLAGDPAPTPRPADGAAGLAPYVEQLRSTARALAALHPAAPDTAAQLAQAAAQATTAAEALAAVRER
ncbi:hypothetical protein [Streptomyces sp. CS090A]|uniref:hypothetical protein n=1 Tax=Streptomyces sp. CS090A TaxID=2162710 RepID=UPI0013A53326|nr:hypothetical protein [Streptomyces sp. CS090A]